MGNRLLPSCTTLCAAPASMPMAPRNCRWSAIHCLRACCFCVGATNKVPMLSPAAKRKRALGSRPQAMTVLAPDPAARLAAKILVSMPPRPMLEPAPPAISSSCGSPAWPVGMSWALGSLRGSALNRPFWSVRMTSASASTKLATKAPNVSLSPNLISSFTTVSFSLMTGNTRCANKVFKVERAFR